jgi:hypothetical protein
MRYVAFGVDLFHLSLGHPTDGARSEFQAVVFTSLDPLGRSGLTERLRADNKSLGSPSKERDGA